MKLLRTFARLLAAPRCLTCSRAGDKLAVLLVPGSRLGA